MKFSPLRLLGSAWHIGLRLRGAHGLSALLLIPLVAFSLEPQAPAKAQEAARPQNVVERRIAASRAKDRRNFTDAQIADGFFKVAFGAEMQLGGPVDRIRKYDKPVRVFIENAGKPDRSSAVAAVVTDIAHHIEHLDLAVTERREDANFIVRLIRSRDLAPMVRRLYGAKGRTILKSLEPACLSGFRKDAAFRIQGSDVILVVDTGEFVFYDCAYEEILQALGPIRDDPSVPWTMFNDDVRKGFFDTYDQLLLNILYDPRIQAGMTRREVRALLPAVLPDVRAIVARLNAPQPAPR